MGIVKPLGLISIFLVFIFSFGLRESYTKTLIHVPITILAFIFLLLLSAHVIPGFNNLKLLNNVYISKDAIPFSLYLNYDSIVSAYGLLLFSVQIKLAKFKELPLIIRSGLFYGLISIVILIPIIFALGFVHWDVKLTKITLLFAIVNLIFTCISEEIFWRGFVQNSIAKYSSSIIAVLITSILFAVIHIVFAGVNFAILAFVASLIYGFSYVKTKRLEVSIICHYFVNMAQFIFVTYPILKSAWIV
ncbi:CPBP family intramembrane glutamic endopeptidase [Pseudofrancisella aestuarii]|uniref:CPBP family intramembrane glutamic endopeptidase n=1 Tax=Pseudofrancisella aestuarii TaxID=2670347 RepID=UPI001FCF080A|nr:CPBP family intramembrane glutamic endopeptidase [Pseudofrancisella aestuarii]